MINKNWEIFINKHLEKKSKIQKNFLTKKNLYIFPNLNGFKLGIFIFFSFASSIFYQNNVGLLVSIIIFIIYFISIIISYQNLDAIKIEPLNCLVPNNKNVYLSFFVEALNNRQRLNLNMSLNKKGGLTTFFFNILLDCLFYKDCLRVDGIVNNIKMAKEKELFTTPSKVIFR